MKNTLNVLALSLISLVFMSSSHAKIECKELPIDQVMAIAESFEVVGKIFSADIKNSDETEKTMQAYTNKRKAELYVVEELNEFLKCQASFLELNK